MGSEQTFASSIQYYKECYTFEASYIFTYTGHFCIFEFLTNAEIAVI